MSKPSFGPSAASSIETLQVVFKVVERCNINCTYCYYFNMGETSALDRPRAVSVATAEALAKWVAQGCVQLHIPNVQISFHGGEPMMLKSQDFGEICHTLRKEIGPVAKLALSIQTNGTILNDAWLGLFEEYEVNVGVSIDGDRRAHDKYRLSFAGRSTFERTEKNLKRLVNWASAGRHLMLSTISVIDAKNDYKSIYEYLRSIGIEQMNFLLPDRDTTEMEDRDNPSLAMCGTALYDIFEAWLREDNPRIDIRHIKKTLGHFQLESDKPTFDQTQVNRNVDSAEKFTQIIIARSDGTVAVNDTYIPALAWYKETPVYSIHTHSLQEFLSDPIFREISEIESTLPSDCTSCKWKGICKGGDIENRFSKDGHFDNRSIYCEGYKIYYQGVCDLLVENGYPPEALPHKR